MKKKRVTVGIDIGGTNTVWGFIDDEGNVLLGNEFATYSTEPPEKLVERIAQAVKSDFLSIESEELELTGIGIGAPNANYHTGNIHHPPNFNWEIVEFVKLLKLHFSVPAVITNDANAAAMGEKHFGYAKNIDDFILITLGTGLGSGIVTGGELLLGHDGFAGEMGHITVDTESKRQCGCGKYGCLETYASAKGIVITALELMEQKPDESSLRLIKKEELTSKDIGKAAEKGDKLALLAFELTGEKLGLALANTVAVLSPKAIFLFGGLANAKNLIVEPAKRHLEKHVFREFKNKVDIRISGLQNRNAAILGAAALAKLESEKSEQDRDPQMQVSL